LMGMLMNCVGRPASHSLHWKNRAASPRRAGWSSEMHGAS